jgi:hypothetical protein
VQQDVEVTDKNDEPLKADKNQKNREQRLHAKVKDLKASKENAPLVEADDVLSKTQHQAMISLIPIGDTLNEENVIKNKAALNPDENKKAKLEKEMMEHFFGSREPEKDEVTRIVDIEQEMYDEMAFDEQKIYISLDEDIYCIGFRTFLRTTNAKQLDRIVLKCIFTFIFQVMVVGLMMMNQLNLQTDGNFSMDGLLSEESVIVGAPTLNMTRLCCCFLLHVSILPELTSAKEMLQFVKLNPTSFTG